MPQAGELYAFPVERIGRFGACQIVAVDEKDRQVTVAVLDWVGDKPPTGAAELAGVGRMVQDFMFWQPHEVVKNVALPVPAEFVRVGTAPISGETTSSSYGGWGFAGQVARQHWWNSLPAELTARFKASRDSDATILTPGLIDSRTDKTFEVRASQSSSFADDAGYRITDEFQMDTLRSWPQLHRFELHAWRDDLIPFLEGSPLAGELVLEGHGQAVIDLSRTHVDDLSIDVTGLERLVVPERLEKLSLRGIPSEGLRIEASEQGRWIAVTLTSSVMPLTGLEGARGLRINGVAELSVADVVQRHPGIRFLHLFGSPGTLRDVDRLAELPALDELWLVDLFGYAPEDFPLPENLPALTSLDLDSVPAEVAAAVRRSFKKAPRVELSVRKPRNPEWLAENVDNPLRHWDGRDGIPAAVVKKVRAAYLAALRQVRAADAERGDNAADAAYSASVVDAVTAFLAVVQPLNAKHEFLYTLERDEVIEAVSSLTVALPSDSQRALEPLIEEALDD